MKERNDFIKLNEDFIKLNFYSMKYMVKRIKRKAQKGKNVCKDKSDKGLFCKICKEFSKLD